MFNSLTSVQLQWVQDFVGFSVDDQESARGDAMAAEPPTSGANASPTNGAAPGGPSVAKPATKNSTGRDAAPAGKGGARNAGTPPVPGALDPGTLDVNPPRLSNRDGDTAWQDAAKQITVQISPYGALTFLKLQGPDLNRLMAPLRASLTGGTAALPKLAEAVKARDDAIAALGPFFNAPDQAANDVEAMAHQEAADEARTAELAKSVENVIRQFGTNLRTQIDYAAHEISAANKELEAQRLFDKAAALKERAEKITKVLDALKEAAKAGIEGAIKEGPEAGAAQAGLSLVKSLAAALSGSIMGNKLLDEAKALEEQAKGMHVSGVTEHLNAAQTALAELETEIQDVANGASVQSKVAARDKKIAVDRFDQQCDTDKTCKSKFRFRLIEKAVHSVNQAMDAATWSYRNWGDAVVHIEEFVAKIEVMVYDNGGSVPIPIDGKRVLNDSEWGRADGAGARAMRAARSHLKTDNAPVTDAIHKDAGQHESEALQLQQALQQQMTRLQALHDKAFAALTATPGKMAAR